MVAIISVSPAWTMPVPTTYRITRMVGWAQSLEAYFGAIVTGLGRIKIGPIVVPARVGRKRCLFAQTPYRNGWIAPIPRGTWSPTIDLG